MFVPRQSSGFTPAASPRFDHVRILVALAQPLAAGVPRPDLPSSFAFRSAPAANRASRTAGALLYAIALDARVRDSSAVLARHIGRGLDTGGRRPRPSTVRKYSIVFHASQPSAPCPASAGADSTAPSMVPQRKARLQRHDPDLLAPSSLRCRTLPRPSGGL